jgi:ATP-binding protein involved in chromosome partitioning
MREMITYNLRDVKYIIPVLSGKGGVGKSIISANLAIGLADCGYSVAIVDSDLHGPSIPSILGLKNMDLLLGSNGIVPPQASLGVKVVSMDFLLSNNRPTTWLSDLKRSAQVQFLANTDYGHLDYLVIDMPPGTGSETVNLFKYLPQISGAIIVTASSDVVDRVVQRCIALCRKAKVPIIGIIENMRSLFCSFCGKTYSPKLLAREMGIPLLGKIDRDPLIVESADKGCSFLLARADCKSSKNFYGIISKIEHALESKRPCNSVRSAHKPKRDGLKKILEMNYGRSCQGRSCFRCTDYFLCNLPKKEDIKSYDILKKIKDAMSGIKHKIAVMSCKGGVGKSTLSVNIAVALTQHGGSAVILDCDFHGPCIPMMLGVESKGMGIYKKGIIPVPATPRVGVVSMDFLLQPHETVTWFDSLKKMTVAQLLYSVDYGKQDYLIIDLPPGTGAESYGLLQFLPDLEGTLIITQPSKSSQEVACRSIELCRQAKVNIIGIIENMSYFICSGCGKISKLCGTMDAKNLAIQMGVPFLGSIPLDYNIFANRDDGVPFVERFPESLFSRSVIFIADNIVKTFETSVDLKCI